MLKPGKFTRFSLKEGIMVLILAVLVVVGAAPPDGCIWRLEQLDMSSGLPTVAYGMETCPGRPLRPIVVVGEATEDCTFVDMVAGTSQLYVVCTDRVLQFVSGAVTTVPVSVGQTWRIPADKPVTQGAPSIGMYPMLGQGGGLLGILRLEDGGWNVDTAVPECAVARVGYVARAVTCRNGAIVPLPP